MIEVRIMKTGKGKRVDGIERKTERMRDREYKKKKVRQRE